MKYLAAAIILATTAPAFAQTAPDAAFLQRAVNVLQAQRNAALDAQAIAEANLAGVKEDLAKAQARIKELTPKSDEAQPK